MGRAQHQATTHKGLQHPRFSEGKVQHGQARCTQACRKMGSRALRLLWGRVVLSVVALRDRVALLTSACLAVLRAQSRKCSGLSLVC